MGAEQFVANGHGETAAEAFEAARQQAYWDYGHAGYTGTIAEKEEFVLIDLPDGIEANRYAWLLFAENDARIGDKWGPCGCLDCGDGDWLFFGWASQ